MTIFHQFLTTELVAGKVLIKPLNSLTLDPDIKSELGVSYTDKNFQFKQSELVSSRKMANFDKKTPFWADFKGNYLIWDVFKSKYTVFQSKLIENRQMDLLEHRISDFITDKVGHRAVN